MKHFLLLISIFLVSQIANSQSDFKKGYILFSENDTIFGQIDNKNYYLNSLYCDFRKNEKDSIKRYYPKDIFGYRFNDGKYYISKSIQKDLKDTSFFFEFLIKSKLNIYFVQNQFENNYYISEDGIKLNKLKYINDDIYIENRKMHRENKQFIGLLNYYTKDCPEIKKDINRIEKPNHKNLIKLTEKYNKLTCPNGQCMIYEKKIPHLFKFEMFYNYNFLFSKKFTEQPFSYSSYGFNILLQQSKQRERFFFGIGLKYNKFTFLINNEKILPHLSIPISFYYLHPGNGFSPMYKISFDIPFLVFQNYGVGLQYKYKRISFFTLTELQTLYIIYPIGVSQRAGFFLNLN